MQTKQRKSALLMEGILLVIVLEFLLIPSSLAQKSPLQSPLPYLPYRQPEDLRDHQLLGNRSLDVSLDVVNKANQTAGPEVLVIIQEDSSQYSDHWPQEEPKDSDHVQIVPPIASEIDLSNTSEQQVTAVIPKSDNFQQGSVSKDTSTFYVVGSSTLAEIDQDNNYRYVHGDHLQSVSMRTEESGTVKTRIEYYPFGEILSEHSEASRLLYNGKEQDKDTGLYYYGQRYYLPSIGRFISVDAWEGQLTNPQTFNKYAYALNNPMSFVDVQGLKPKHFQEARYIMKTHPRNGYTYVNERPAGATAAEAVLVPLKMYNEYKAAQRDFAAFWTGGYNNYWRNKNFDPGAVLPSDYYVTHTFDVPRDFILQTLKQTPPGKEFDSFLLFSGSKRWEGKGGTLYLDGQPVTPEEQALYLNLYSETHPPRTETVYQPVFQAPSAESDPNLVNEAVPDATRVDQVPIKIQHEWVINPE